MTDGSVFIGIDVAKAHLDVAVRPDDDTWQAANDASGIAALVAHLDQLRPTLVVLEATGGYERPVTASLVAAGVPVAVVNPRHAAQGAPGDFAKATGKLAKTDTLDAHVLAHFADAVRPTPRPLPERRYPDVGCDPGTAATGGRDADGGAEPPAHRSDDDFGSGSARPSSGWRRT